MALPAIVGALLRGLLKEIAKTGGKEAILKSAIRSLPKTVQQEGVKFLIANTPIGAAKRIAKTFKSAGSLITHPLKFIEKNTIKPIKNIIKTAKSLNPYALARKITPANRLAAARMARKQLLIVNTQLKVAPLSRNLRKRKIQLELALKRSTKLASMERRYERMLVKESRGSGAYQARIKGLKGKALEREISAIEAEVRQRAREELRNRQNQRKLHWVEEQKFNRLNPDDTKNGRYKTEGVSGVSGREYKIHNGEIYYLN